MAKEAEKTRLWHNLELKLVRFLNYCAKFCVAIALIFLPQEYGVENEEDEVICNETRGDRYNLGRSPLEI
ncbi:hypothetical protein [Nostoc sp.]|uniref:hypothetical protein n=1 Tax=Nostoc sp. TaxID=1180 RepID=UPI002FF2C941